MIKFRIGLYSSRPHKCISCNKVKRMDKLFDFEFHFAKELIFYRPVCGSCIKRFGKKLIKSVEKFELHFKKLDKRPKMCYTDNSKAAESLRYALKVKIPNE